MKRALAINALSIGIAVVISWAIFTVLAEYDVFESESEDIINADLAHIADVQIPALVQTHKIQSDLLEGVEEAFAYIILDDKNEKIEFYQKMADFEDRVDNYITFDLEFDDTDVEENKELMKIIIAQANLVASADAMFESFESGELDLDTVLAFEKNIDKIVPLIDELIDEEIEDISEHIHELDEKINESSSDDEEE